MIIKAGLASLFSGLAGPLARKVLTGLGFGVISYAGISGAFQAVLSVAQSSYNGMAPMIFQLAGLGGIGDACGIVAGAMAFRIGFTSLSKLGILPK